MKIGFNLLLWTTAVTEAHRPVLEALKAAGCEGVEVPVFEGTPDDFARVGRMLDAIGLEREAVWRNGANFFRDGVAAAHARRAA